MRTCPWAEQMETLDDDWAAELWSCLLTASVGPPAAAQWVLRLARKKWSSRWRDQSFISSVPPRHSREPDWDESKGFFFPSFLSGWHKFERIYFSGAESNFLSCIFDLAQIKEEEGGVTINLGWTVKKPSLFQPLENCPLLWKALFSKAAEATLAIRPPIKIYHWTSRKKNCWAAILSSCLSNTNNYRQSQETSQQKGAAGFLLSGGLILPAASYPPRCFTTRRVEPIFPEWNLT